MTARRSATVSPDRDVAWTRWLGAVAALVLALALAAIGPASAQAARDDPITLNFKDADIDSVIGAFGYLLDRTFVIDPRVRGKITVETPRPVSRAQAYTLLLAALRLQGFTIVEAGALAKVVPEADAKLQSGPVSARRPPSSSGDQIVTQIFRLNYESASNLVPVLRPLIAPNNTIVAYPSNNSLVVTDYASNLRRVARIIATLDSPSTSEIEVIPVRNAIATDIAMAVARLLDDSQRTGPGAQIDPGQRVLVLADPRLNAVMVRSGSPSRINLAKTLVARLDRPTAEKGDIHVVYLRNAEAVKLAETLRAALSGDGQGLGSFSGSLNRASSALTGGATGARSPTATGASTTPGGASPASPGSSLAPVTISAGGATIAADPTTNALIITAPEAVYRNLRHVIEKLDVRRAQVYIESLIVEVTADTAAEFGIQWQFLNAPSGSTRAIGGTNFSNSDGSGNIIGAASNLSQLGQGLNIGVVRGTVTIPGVGEILNLGLLARALESQGKANILATPNLLTLDNEEAKIIIGQNVPFVTGQFTNTGAAAGAVSPFQTIERKDVGTTLRVKPQVSESGTVKLQIFQEVSAVQSTALAAGIVTSKRSIESNVLVDDGQLIVLGGLIEERITGGESKVPGFGDVPLLGQLFRYDERRRTKTNLLVFLRPIVVRDSGSAFNVTADRYDYMRQLRGDSRLPNHWLLPQFRPEDLPEMPTRKGGAARGIDAAAGAARPGDPASQPAPPASATPAPPPGSSRPPPASSAPDSGADLRRDLYVN